MAPPVLSYPVTLVPTAIEFLLQTQNYVPQPYAEHGGVHSQQCNVAGLNDFFLKQYLPMNTAANNNEQWMHSFQVFLNIVERKSTFL